MNGMEQNNGAPAGGMNNPKRSLFDQPRKVVSGIVFSGTIVGMVLISLVFSITLGFISAASDTPVGELQTTDVYKYFSYLLYQVVYVGVMLAFALIYKARPCEFGYRKVRARYFFIAIVLAFGLLFSLDKVNRYFLELLELIGYSGGMSDASSLPSMAGAGIVGALAVVAVLPAFLEESIFRGVMLEGMKALGTAAACLLGGLCFSLFHQNPEQTIYQFICGAAFTLLAIRADSLLPAVLCHFLNNAVIVCNYKFAFLQNVPSSVAVALYVISGVCLAGSLVYLIFFDKKTNRRKEGEIRPFFLAALVVGATGCLRSFRSNFRPKKFSPDGVHPTWPGYEYIVRRRQERDSFGK